MPEGRYDPVGSPCWSRLLAGPVERAAHAGAGLLAGLVTSWGPTLEQPVPEGLDLVGRTHAEAVSEELQPVGRTHVGETVSHERDLTLEQGKRGVLPLRMKERQRQHVMN